MFEAVTFMLIGFGLVFLLFKFIRLLSEKKPKAAIGLPLSFAILMAFVMNPLFIVGSEINEPFYSTLAKKEA